MDTRTTGTHGRDVAQHLPAAHPKLADVLSSIAAGQHGVVLRQQLLHAGFAAHSVDRCVASNRLRILHRGVYEVTGMATLYTPFRAALLACGPQSVLGGGAAGTLWAILEESPGSLLEVFVPGVHRNRTSGLSVRRVRGFLRGETTSLVGMRITTPARTILDLAGVLSPRQLAQAIATAEHAGTMRRDELGTLLQRRPLHRGSGVLRRLLNADGPFDFTRSPAEEKLLSHILRAGLPRPQVNVRVAGFVVDFLFRREKLVVEVDGFAFHSSARAYHSDRRRDAILLAQGYRVMRVTWNEIHPDPLAAIVRLAQALVR